MQKMHTIKYPIITEFISYFIVDKSTQLEFLLLESTLAFMNFMICKPSLTFGSKAAKSASGAKIVQNANKIK